MSFTADDVVNAARDRHPSFDPKSAPNEVGYRYLDQFAGALASDIMQRRPEAMTVTALVTPLPLAVFSSGIAVPANLMVTEVTALRTGDTSPNEDAPVALLAPSQRFRFSGNGTVGFGILTLTAYLNGSTLQLGSDATAWSPYASITVRYIPVPSVTTGASVLPFPDDAMTPCVSALAEFFGMRRQGMSDAPPAGLWAREAADDRQTFLDRIQRQFGVEEVRVQDVYGDRGGW